jgi:hypothetical protein
VPSQAQLHPAGVGVGDHVGQRPQPQAGLVWHGKATASQQRPDLADGAGDGRAVHAKQHRQGLVRELQAQVDQGHQHAVAEGQPVVGAGAAGAAAPMATAVGQPGLVLGGPGAGQLGDEVAEVLPGDAGEARMGQGRTDPCWSSHPGMIVRPRSCPHDPLDQPHQSRTKS